MFSRAVPRPSVHMRRACLPPHSLHALVVACVLLQAHQCVALSTTGLPDRLWQQVLDVEPNRHLQQLGQISETEGQLTRTYFSDAHKQAAQQIKRWIEQAGMTSHIDAMGNVHGVVEGSQPELGELLVGSHYDTVVDGGKYDGALGLLLGIAAVKGVLLEAAHRAGKLGALQGALDQALSSQNSVIDIEAGVGDVIRDLELPAAAVRGLLPGSVRVVGFCDEEGIRFKSTFLGSRAIAGSLLKHNQLAAVGPDGLSLEQVLRGAGVQNPAEAVAAIALDPKQVRHYVEFHIEQGPQLEAAGLALGVVGGIAGQTWLSVAVEGEQGHGGTVPMALRRDPMPAAAEAVAAIEALCKGRSPSGSGSPALAVEGQALVCTVGRMHVHPNQVNIIPRWVNFTVDVRCRDQGFRQQVAAAIEAQINSICDARGLNCSISRTHDAPPVLSDERLIGKLQAAILRAQPLIRQLVPPASSSSEPDVCTSSSSSSSSADGGGACSSSGSSSTSDFTASQNTVPVLLSGAGHDAMAIADITPAIAMVFVRCAGGISHNPAEHTEPRDVAAAAAAFATFMEMDLLDHAENADDSFALVADAA